jgi:hypothetical protein
MRRGLEKQTLSSFPTATAQPYLTASSLFSASHDLALCNPLLLPAVPCLMPDAFIRGVA